MVIALGVFLRFPDPAPNPTRRAPALIKVRLIVLGLLVNFFGLDVFAPHSSIPTAVVARVEAGLFGFGLWHMRSWSAGTG